MDDVALEAGLAKATLYLHFDSKVAVFRAMIDGCRIVVSERVRAAEASSEPLATRLADLLYAYGGSALEWFGDASNIAELRSFASDFPEIGDRATVRAMETARVAALISKAATDSAFTLNRFDGSAVDVAGMLVDVANGAKLIEPTSLREYKHHLDIAASLVVEALRADRRNGDRPTPGDITVDRLSDKTASSSTPTNRALRNS